MNAQETIAIPKILDIQIAFGTTEGLPVYADIPEEFTRSRTPWNSLFSKMFFSGIKGLKLVPNDGVDADAAWRHIRALSASFEPKHEHKEAGVAYLMSRYFKSAVWDGGSTQ